MPSSLVLVDADFCNMLAPGENVPREINFIKSVFNLLDKRPVLHTFVFTEELQNQNLAINTLVSENFMDVAAYSDVCIDTVIRQQYTDEFRDFYFFMNSEEIEPNFEKITSHKAGKNMGEIHSLIFAHYLIFLFLCRMIKGLEN